tara:strand:+ start:202 stop:366 length:165 start_codon:yes stop_codon:yes gene_type:complete
MNITFQPIVGCQVGIEFYEQNITIPKDTEVVIGYCLLDFFVIRMQIAWYVGEPE